MALIAFPSTSLSQISCNLVYPGQDIIQSIYTGSVQATPRGIGRWEGLITFPQLGRTDGAEDIGRIEAFIASTEGAVHVFDLPFEAIAEAQKTRFPEGADVRVTSIERTGGSFIANINQANGLQLGDRVTIDNRMFVVIIAHSGGQCTLSPYRPLTIPTGGLPINWRAPTLRARLTQRNPSSAPYSAFWAGPWALAFQDVL